ncbi:hypothetical protein FOZ62_009952, partial [Perkinsus olseni]
DYVRDLLQEVRLTTSPFICYSDASSGFGLGIAAPQQFTIPRLAGKLKLAPTTTHINLLEIIAAGAALESFRDYISTKPALIFVDSTTCESLIIRGSTISPILNIIGGKFWKRVAELGITTLFVAHVASKLNYADSLSRGGDLEEFDCDDYNSSYYALFIDLRHCSQLSFTMASTLWLNSTLGLQALLFHS